MDRKSKILSFALVLLIIWSIWATYDRIVVRRDYLISVEVPCDPVTEKCFVYEEEGKESYFYKIVEKPAYDLPNCDSTSESCLESIICVSNEIGCTLIYCDLSLGENCSNFSVSENGNENNADSGQNVTTKNL